MSLRYLLKLNIHITHSSGNPPFIIYPVEMQVYEIKEIHVC